MFKVCFNRLLNMYTFEVIDPNSKEDIAFLYNLIINKLDNISNNKKPSFEEHRHFVENHPYKEWYKVNFKDVKVGTFYLSKVNTIGINLKSDNYKTYMEVLKKIFLEYKPDPEINSIRNKHFTINSSPTNQVLIKALKELGLELIQETYIYRDIK